MSTSNTTSEYLLLFRGNEGKNLSPEECQLAADRGKTWFERLTAQGRIVAAKPLEREGTVISNKKGGVITDGPFAETKEAVGGYAIVRATSLEDATAIARECPNLSLGISIEVRPLADECPLFKKARETRELASPV